MPNSQPQAGAAGAKPRDPAEDRRTLEAVVEAARLREHARAAALARAALASGLEHPVLFNVVALDLELAGRLAEAAEWLHRAVEVAPRDVGVRNALGLCLLQLERPAEALEQFDALAASNPEFPFVHVSRGNALRALGQASEAEASYRRAVAIDAEHPLAWAGLAQISAHRGTYREARFRAQKALAAAPDLPDAVMALGTAELGERELSQAEARIRALLEAQSLAPLPRAYARGLLGDILDAAGRLDEAFAAYTACNESLRQLYAGRFGSPSALEYVEAMNSTLERSAPGPWQARVPAAARDRAASGHVFLLGFPRSGTTLLEVILEGHPDVTTLEEKDSLIDATLELMRHPGDLEWLPRLVPGKLDALRAAYWGRVARAGVDVAGKLFIDKYPLNTLRLPLIGRLFPDAKILFACRDPRDVVLSCFRHRFQMSAPIYELLTIAGAARYYDAVMRLAIRCQSLLKLDTCLVRHEDVVREFAREMKRICEFLGLEWHPGMGDFALRTKNRAVLTPSTAQLVRGLSTEGLGHWHRYRPQLEPVLEQLAPWVSRFSYEP